MQIRIGELPKGWYEADPATVKFRVVREPLNEYHGFTTPSFPKIVKLPWPWHLWTDPVLAGFFQAAVANAMVQMVKAGRARDIRDLEANIKSPRPIENVRHIMRDIIRRMGLKEGPELFEFDINIVAINAAGKPIGSREGLVIREWALMSTAASLRNAHPKFKEASPAERWTACAPMQVREGSETRVIDKRMTTAGIYQTELSSDRLFMVGEAASQR